MEQLPLTAADGLGGGSQEATELRRYRESLRRSWLLIIAIVVPLTALVLVISLLLPPTYLGSATIVLSDEGFSRAGGDPEAVRRELETVERLVKTRPVLAAAARRLRTESADTLSEKVSSSASAEANLVRVTAEDGDASGAAQIANAVARAFLAERAAAERRSVAAARQTLLRRIERLKGTGRQGEIATLREGLRELALEEANLGAGLALAERARAADRPDSPRVLQNTLFALFGFAFIAVLIALARDQIAPRVRDARQFARLVGAPLLIEMPAPRPSSRGARPQVEAFELLAEGVQTLLRPAEVQTVLVTSLQRERASVEIAAGVAETLARESEKTVLVDSTSGRPDSGAPPAPVSELVRRLTSGSADIDGALALAEIRPGLIVFSHDANAALGSRSELKTLVDGLAEHDVRFLVVVGPSLLSREGLLLPRLFDGLLLVCRPQRSTRDEARRVGELLRASDANVIGIVSIGARQLVPYEIHGETPVIEPSRRL